MEQWDEQALREINNLDAARLAIRGALATIRDLQDGNAALKGQVQDEAAKRKHLESQLEKVGAKVADWQAQAEGWAKERAERERMMEQWKGEARLEVRTEERARLEDDRRRTEETIAHLRSDIAGMATGQKEREEGWAQLRGELERREMEIAALRREKEEALDRARHELDLVESLRTSRDREIAASIRSRELELQDRENQIQALKRAHDEAQKTLASLTAEQEMRVKAREEVHAKAYQLKEKDLVERYQKRETELQAQWSELEQGLWAKAKQSRSQLDEAVQKQFEERGRQLADRANEIEALLVSRKAELDADVERRCAEAEARYAENERRLVDGWGEKEKRLVARARLELEGERTALREDWLARGRALEVEHAERLRGSDARAAELERELKHKGQRLLEEAARKDGDRVRAQDEFAALKTAELEKLHGEKLAELAEHRRLLDEEARAREERRQNDFLARQAALVEEHEGRRAELLEEHRRSTAAESASLAAQYDQRQHALDEDHAAKAAEFERASHSLAAQFESWKASIREEFLRKEKELDARWAARETELTRKYDTALEDQRRAFASETAALRDHAEAARRRVEEETLRREQSARADYERGLTQLRETHARDCSARAAAHDARLVELRALHDEALRIARETSFEDLARERTKLAEENALLQERIHAHRAEAERKALADAARIKDLDARLAAAEQDRRALSETASARERDAAALRAALAERDRMRELDRARVFEEARLISAGELAQSLEEAERQRALAFAERLAELERALVSRKRSLETSLSERARALDAREMRLAEESGRLDEKRRGAPPRDTQPPAA
jgi:hypothetical protein